jgi:Right handed beta helix region
VIASEPQAPGISLRGTNITVTNSVVARPRGGDGDGIRFWGRDIRIAHNTVTDTRGQDERHADCMQTFATDEQHPASQDVLIEANRCERIDNICLIAEGPNSEAGDGSGQGRSRKLVFRHNYCDNRAGQAVFIDDVSDVAVVGNRIVGPVSKAFAFQNGATGALVRDNELGPKIGYEVGIDESSEDGYNGPEPGGAP